MVLLRTVALRASLALFLGIGPGRALAAQEPGEPKVASLPALLTDFVGACGEPRDAGRCTAVLTRLAAAPAAPSALPTLRGHTQDVPIGALVSFTRVCADLLPYGSAADRDATVDLANAIEERAELFAKERPLELPELANQISRVFNRGTVAAAGPIEALQKQVDDGFEQVREAACEALGRRGKAALPAVDSLQNLLERKLLDNGHTKLLGQYYVMKDQPRHAAARALAAICPADARSARAHAFLVQNGESATERRTAAVALGQLGTAGEEGVSALLAATELADLALAREAITALGQIGTAAAVPRLEALAAGKDRQLAALAAAALRQLRRKPAK